MDATCRSFTASSSWSIARAVRSMADAEFTSGCGTFGDFFDQPKVADAVWDLFRDVFGIQKTSVRVVIGRPAQEPVRARRTAGAGSMRTGLRPISVSRRA
jgi:hypothetical protein